MGGTVENLGLYIHVPFCSGKCFYCDFYSIPADSELIDQYLQSLAKEAELVRQTFFENQKPLVETLFIGGGTPTSLEPVHYEKMIQIIDANFERTDDCEFTCEANPESVTAEKIKILKAGGLNRLSIGTQTFDDHLLKKIGRRHTSRQTVSAVELALEQGIKNIGLDLIFALPEQTVAGFQNDLITAVGLLPEHLSCYELTNEPETPIYALRPTAEDTQAEDRQVEMFHLAHDFLTGKGFDHYEISNFAKPGFQCRHNIRYWKNLEYVGLGPSAAGFLNRKRYKNVSSNADYTRQILSDIRLPVETEETLTDRKFAGETAMLNLRTTMGIDKNEFSERTGYDPFALFAQQIKKFTRLGLLEIKGEQIALTVRGFPLANEVIAEFLF